MRECQGELNLVGGNISIAAALYSRTCNGGSPEGGSGEASGVHDYGCM